LTKLRQKAKFNIKYLKRILIGRGISQIFSLLFQISIDGAVAAQKKISSAIFKIKTNLIR